MNNPRLLAGLLCAALASGGAAVSAQRVVTLEEIFASADSSALRLRPYRTAAEEADGAIKVARSGLLPEINASVSLGYNGDGFTTKRDFSGYERAPIPPLATSAGIIVTQPVYTGGAVTNAIRMAELESTAARFAADLQRDNLRFRLAGFYLDLYRLANLRKVVDSNIASANAMLEDMRARYEQGTALRNDITRYELLVSNLELQRIKLDNSMRIVNDNLVTTAGLPDNTVVVPDSAILTRSLPMNGEAWWQLEAVAESPALAAASNAVSMADRAEAITRAERLPKVALQAGWSLEGPILVEVPPIDRNLSYWYVGVGVSYNISSLYKTDRKLAVNRLASLKAREELDAARENLELDIRSAYVRYLEAYEELKTQRKAVELAEQNYAVTSTRYSAGMALVTDLLDAADARLDSGEKLVNAHIDIVYNYYKLLFMSGKI